MCFRRGFGRGSFSVSVAVGKDRGSEIDWEFGSGREQAKSAKNRSALNVTEVRHSSVQSRSQSRQSSLRDRKSPLSQNTLNLRQNINPADCNSVPMKKVSVIPSVVPGPKVARPAPPKFPHSKTFIEERQRRDGLRRRVECAPKFFGRGGAKPAATRIKPIDRLLRVDPKVENRDLEAFFGINENGDGDNEFAK